MKPWKRIGLRPAIGLVIEEQADQPERRGDHPGGRKEVARDSPIVRG